MRRLGVVLLLLAMLLSSSAWAVACPASSTPSGTGAEGGHIPDRPVIPPAAGEAGPMRIVLKVDWEPSSAKVDVNFNVDGSGRSVDGKFGHWEQTVLAKRGAEVYAVAREPVGSISCVVLVGKARIKADEDHSQGSVQCGHWRTQDPNA